MPRFSPEQVPNALQEQIYREMLKGMLDKEPMDWHGNQFREHFYARPQGEMQYGSIDVPVVNERMQQSGTFDDSRSQQQTRTDRRRWEDAYLYSKPNAVIPFHQNNPPAFRDEFEGIGDAVGNTTMSRMYNQMPNQLNRYPMMEMPPPDQSQQMDQLMQFYTNEDI
jgi:hypothetical protein